jgi:hypothetical protein
MYFSFIKWEKENLREESSAVFYKKINFTQCIWKLSVWNGNLFPFEGTSPMHPPQGFLDPQSFAGKKPLQLDLCGWDCALHCALTVLTASHVKGMQ